MTASSSLATPAKILGDNMKYMILIQEPNRYLVLTGWMTYTDGDILQATKFNSKEEAFKVFKDCKVNSSWIHSKIIEYDEFNLWKNK